MQDWKVPGLAIAVVKDGAVVMAEGFGRRDVARGLAVTPRTLFAIASCTKAFTTMGMAMLADDGRLDWDTPVKTYLPTFAMHDPFATERMTPRDLVTHRSGLPGHDLMWYRTAYTRREIVDRLRYLEPTRDFRSVWQYQNLMYMTAGYLVGHLAGHSWEDFTRARILQPLGMSGSNLSVTESQAADDAALPYTEEQEEVRQIPFRNMDTDGPAGGINSSVAEMSAWLLLHLNQGRHGEHRLVSDGQMAEMHAPQMVVPGPSKHDELASTSYGLGWAIGAYRGHRTIAHVGGIDGFSALVTLLPQARIGVVVLTNLNGNPVPSILAYNVYDRLLGLDQVPWSERFKQEHAAFKEAAEQGKAKGEADRVPNTQPSHTLDQYAGAFEHPAYGIVAVARAGDQLQATYNAITSPLTHYHYDIFEFRWQAGGTPMKVTFFTNVKGAIDSLAAPFESTVPDIVFKRRPRQEMTSKAFLEKLTGAYELMGMRLTVALKGDAALLVSIPGLPEFELVPYQGTEFTAKGLSGVSVEFKLDASGVATEVIVTQANRVFTATKTTTG